MKPSYLALLVLVVAGGGIFLLQLWFELFEDEIFFKIMITVAILIAIIGAVIAIRHDTEEDDKLKKDKFIN